MTGFLNGLGGVGRLLFLVALGAGVGAVFASGEARGVLGVVALSLVIPGLVLTSIARSIGKVSGVSEDLVATGVPGTAVVQAMGDTGVTINEAPVVEFTLDVTLEGEEPFTVGIKQILPRLLVGAVVPGSTVSVIADTETRRDVAIDFSHSPGAPQPSPAAKPTFEVSSAADLLRTGRRGTATIRAVTDLGDISDLEVVSEGSPNEDDRVYVVEMDVKLPGRQPFPVKIGHRVPIALYGKVGPGATVAVAVDRSNDQDVAIDWDTLA